MKTIQPNRQVLTEVPVPSRSAGNPDPHKSAMSPFRRDHRVSVDPDGREYFAVPLKDAKLQEETPFLAAEFSLPAPELRVALILELAKILAKAAVDQLLKEEQVS